MANEKPHDPKTPNTASPSTTDESAPRSGMVGRGHDEANPSRRDQEIGSLQKANADVEAGYERIQQQTELLEELSRDGHDTATALELLAALQDAQQVMLEHRKLIVDEIERLGRTERDRI